MPALQSWSEIYKEHGHEIPMDLWHGYIGSDRGFEPLEHLDALGIAPHEALALEDSPNGIAAAKGAGLRCVAVPNPLTAGMDLSGADLRIGSLAATPLESVLAVLARD